MLSARDLTFAYRRRTAGGSHAPPVLDGVSVDLPPGALLGILGPNGSGKTTLLRLLGGVLTPSSGTVSLDGRPLSSWSRPALARRIAIVPQETHPAFDYTVLEMVLMGRYPHLGAFGVEGPDDLAIARDALRATGVDALEDRDFATLSGGEKQRVVIAAALAQQADILLLDEPTASLDPRYQLETATLLREIHATRGIRAALATHDLNLAAAVCRDLILLRGGRVIASGPIDGILTPAHVRAAYDVEADIRYHERAGHLTVVPLGRSAP